MTGPRPSAKTSPAPKAAAAETRMAAKVQEPIAFEAGARKGPARPGGEVVPPMDLTAEAFLSSGPEKREWTWYPQNLPVTSSLGTLEMAITDGDHLHIEGGNTTGRPRGCQTEILLNDRRYWGSIHFYRGEDGVWAPGKGASEIYVRRSLNEEAPPSFRDKFVKSFTEAVNAFMKDHEHLRMQAEAANANNEITRVDKTLEKLRAELNALEAERAGLVSRETEALAAMPLVLQLDHEARRGGAYQAPFEAYLRGLTQLPDDALRAECRFLEAQPESRTVDGEAGLYAAHLDAVLREAQGRPDLELPFP